MLRLFYKKMIKGIIMFKGAFTALVTPFLNNRVDTSALSSIVEWQIKQQIDGLVACGSTGESSLLSHDEQKKIIDTVVKSADGRIPVVGGVSAMTSDETVFLANQAEKLGVQAVMVVTPPYIKPTQQAIFDYFSSVHDRCSIPIILYDNPSRAGTVISDDVVIKLSKLPRVVALKDATKDLTRPVRLRARVSQDFLLLSGEDITTTAFLAQGGDGVISVTANVVPDMVAMQIQAWQNVDLDLFATVRDKLAPLHEIMFIESSPAPAKYSLSLLRKCLMDVREPLCNLTTEAQRCVQAVLSEANVL